MADLNTRYQFSSPEESLKLFRTPRTRGEAIQLLLGQTDFSPRVSNVAVGGQAYDVVGDTPETFQLLPSAQSAREFQNLNRQEFDILTGASSASSFAVGQGATLERLGPGTYKELVQKDQGAPTEFETFYNEQLAKGKTPEYAKALWKVQTRREQPELFRNEPTAPNQVISLPKATEAPITSATSPGEGYIKGYDTNNGGAQVWVKAGQYYPGISLYPTPTSSITPDKMQPEKTIVLPAPTGTGGADVAGSFVAGAGATLSEIMKQLTPTEQTPAQIKQQSFLDQIASLTGQEAQKAADQLTAEQSAGLPALRQQFADINSQILSKTAEYNALQTENQNKPITMNSIIGNERAILNARAADIGLLQARALGLQGQIETAQNTANRAIDLKYSTIEAQLNVYQAQLNALAPTLNAEERRLAQAQQILLDQRSQALKDSKDQEKAIQGVMLDAINAHITDSKVLNAIGNAKTVEQALSLYGQNIPASLGVEGETVQALITKYPDAGISINDSLSTAQAKLKTSRIYQEQVRGPVGSQTTQAQKNAEKEEKQIQEFRKASSELVGKLDSGDTTWGSAYDQLRIQYPQATPETINSMLGGGIPYDPATGSFDTKKAWGRAKK